MKISKLKIVFKFIFGGKEGVIDYVLTVLNDFLCQPDVSEKAKEGYEMAMKVLGYLQKFASWCPRKWEREYSLLIQTVSTLTGVFQDGKLTQDEVEKCVEQFKKAYADWNSED